jgi:D-methionine transport system substrate-binding protein
MKNDFTRRFMVCASLALLPFFTAAPARADQTVRVGIMSAEDEDLWAVVSQEAKKHGLAVKLTVFNDYTQPNEALENGDLEAVS